MSFLCSLTNSANRLWIKKCWRWVWEGAPQSLASSDRCVPVLASTVQWWYLECVFCINHSPATKSQARQSKPDPWLCSATETCWLPRHGSAHHAHKCFLPHLLSENNPTSFVKHFMLLKSPYCFDLAARRVIPADHCLFRLKNLGRRPFSVLERGYRENAESPLSPWLTGPSAAIALFNAALMLLLLQPKEKWKWFCKKPYSGFGFDPEFSQSKSLDTGRGQENSFRVTAGLDLVPQKRTCFQSKLSFLSSLAQTTMWYSLIKGCFITLA